MNHADVQDRLGPYLEGELVLQQRALVDAHLDACEACAEELRELRAMVDLLQGLPDVSPPAGLADRVLARVRAGEANATLLGRALGAVDAMLRPGVWTPVLAGALGAVAIVVLQQKTQPVAPVRSTLVVAPTPVAQVPAPPAVRRSGPPFVVRFGPTGALELQGTPFRPSHPMGAAADFESAADEVANEPRFPGPLGGAGREQWADSVREQALRYDLSNELDRSLRATSDRSAIPVDFPGSGTDPEDR